MQLLIKYNLGRLYSSPELELWITWENITLGNFKLGKLKLNPELELLTKFNLGSVWPSPNTTQKIKFCIKDFFSKSDQIGSSLWIWPHLLKKSLTENFIFCTVQVVFRQIWNEWTLFVTRAGTFDTVAFRKPFFEPYIETFYSLTR